MIKNVQDAVCVAHILFWSELLVGCVSEPASLRLTPPYQIKVERCSLLEHFLSTL